MLNFYKVVYYITSYEYFISLRIFGGLAFLRLELKIIIIEYIPHAVSYFSC